MNQWIKLGLMFATSAVGTIFCDANYENTLALATKKRTDDKPTPVPQETTQQETAPVVPQYSNRFGFSVDRLVYERTKNDSFYLGLDAWLGLGISNNRHRHHRVVKLPEGEIHFINSSHHVDNLFESELRFGYNLFYNQRDRITPFFGTGYMFNNVDAFHNAKFAYATAGVLYVHDFNPTFSLGANGKMLAGQQIANRYRKKFAWGIDVSIPFIFHLASSDWDITAEPYVLYMNSHDRHSALVGSRGTIGYRF